MMANSRRGRGQRHTSARVSKRRNGATASIKEQLTDIPGVGARKAQEIIDAGLTSMKQLRSRYYDMLPAAAKVALDHVPAKIIPQATISAMAPDILGYDPKRLTIAGSYRRGNSTSGDIDVVFKSARPDELKQYLQYLRRRFDEVHVTTAGPEKMSLIIHRGAYYKMDIFRADPAHYYAMLLYATGPKGLNMAMRAKAKSKGYLLNQRGLYKGTKKINKATDDEHAIRRLID
jgi:DNA polymerase/3'-5' exonuclease PolX